MGPVLWVKHVSTWDGKYCAGLDDGIKGAKGRDIPLPLVRGRRFGLAGSHDVCCGRGGGGVGELGCMAGDVVGISRSFTIAA